MQDERPAFGDLITIASAVLDVDLTRGIQIWEAGALVEAARPAGLPDPHERPEVRSYAETQGFAAYTPPPAPFPLAPTVPALIWWAVDPVVADVLRTLLSTRYPPSHPVRQVTLDPTGAVQSSAGGFLGELSAVGDQLSGYSFLVLPGLAIDQRGADGLRWVTARLLGPGGCPWDVRQTHQSLRSALLEEAYEVLEALDAGDMQGLNEELGDLLIVVFGHSEMARQAGHFGVEQVFEQITSKLIRRHPHVFDDLQIDGEGQVVQNWEQIKAAELAEKGKPRTSALDGVPPGLPALAVAQKLGKKAARAGFNWEHLPQVWAKLREELDELAAAVDNGDRANAAEELGDTLFVLARIADWLHIDAEMALRDANRKFRQRFTLVEAAVTARGQTLSELSLDELATLWNRAKSAGKS